MLRPWVPERHAPLLSVLLAMLFAPGCASILNKGNDQVVFSSEPSGATVRVNGFEKGTTPFTYNYRPDDGREVIFEFHTPGHRTTTVTMRPGMQKSVIFADAMLLGIPWLVDHNSPNLYTMPAREYQVRLYKEMRDDLPRVVVPLAGVITQLGERPDLGTLQRKRITLKDPIFRELGYADPLGSAMVTGLKDSWMTTRLVRSGTTKGDEAIRSAKVYLRPVISQVKADLMGKISNCSGTMDLAIDWRFHSSHNDSLLFSTVTNTRYMVSAARGHEVLNDAVTHAARVLLEDETLNERLAGVRSAGMAMAKGGQIQLKKPLPVQFAGRKDMMSALVKAVVTIQTEKGHGSGFVITNDGHVITNEHVVGRDGQVKVKFEQGFTLTGEVLKTNKDHDLALIKVDAADLPALAIGNDAELMLGEEIFAIGTPLDAALGQSVSRGILSGRRDLDGLQFLQTDVSINPGNSGGPLIDENGTVVGVATMKISGQGMEGLGFGVPISRALEMLNITMK
jgi:hypothetical protein